MTGHEEAKRWALVAAATKWVQETIAGAVADAGCRPKTVDVADAVREATSSMALAVFELGPELEDELEAIARMRRIPGLEGVPVLAVTALRPATLDLWQLRALGISGLIPARALPEHIRFRIGQLVHTGADVRRHVRAPCSFAVDIGIDGRRYKGWSVSLSEGGMGLVTRKEIKSNSLIELQFELDGRSISLEGRTVGLRRARRKAVEYEVSLFFLRLSGESLVHVRRYVDDTLRRWKEMGGNLSLP